MHMCMHATEPCGGWRTVLWRFSPPILLEVPGIGLRSPGLCSKYSYSPSHCAGPLSAPVSLSCSLESVLYSTLLKCSRIALPLKSILPVGAQPRTALNCSKVCTFDSGLASSFSVEVIFFRNYSPHLGWIPISTVLLLRLSSGNNNSTSSKALTKYVLDVSRRWTRHGGLGTEQHHWGKRNLEATVLSQLWNLKNNHSTWYTGRAEYVSFNI